MENSKKIDKSQSPPLWRLGYGQSVLMPGTQGLCHSHYHEVTPHTNTQIHRAPPSLCNSKESFREKQGDCLKFYLTHCNNISQLAVILPLTHWYHLVTSGDIGVNN